MINITDKIAQALVLPLIVATGLSALGAGAAGWFGLHWYGKAKAAEVACESRVQKLIAESAQASAATERAASAQIAADADAAIAKIDAAFASITQEQGRLTDQYWTRLRKLQPMPANCGPGQQRVDAFNARGQ